MAETTAVATAGRPDTAMPDFQIVPIAGLPIFVPVILLVAAAALLAANVILLGRVRDFA